MLLRRLQAAQKTHFSLNAKVILHHLQVFLACPHPCSKIRPSYVGNILWCFRTV